MRSRSNWNLKVLVLKQKGEPKYPEKNLGARCKRENRQQTQPTYGVDARIRTRVTLMGGKREIRLLKEQDEGVKNTCSSSRIHFLWLF